MATVRPPAVAGSFYPADAQSLRAVVVEYLRQAHGPSAPKSCDGTWPKALIVPHAGYMYSGLVAARAYATLEPGADIAERIILIGPSHHVSFDGIALPSNAAFETPLGRVPVDETSRHQALTLPFVHTFDDAHDWEHSLEVQLPFLLVVAAGIPVVPLLTGDVHPVGAADAIESIFDDETLLLVSSDLSHYHDSDTARRLDAETAASIERLDPGALSRESACGRTGVQAALYVARRCGYRVQPLDLRNSSDTAGPPDRVVGYGTFAIGS